MSKFTDKPNEDPRFPKDEYPYQFKIDTKIDEKFKIWAPILLSMLVDIAYKTQGKVIDVDIVTSATDKYRDDQDIYLEFINQCIVPKPHPSGSSVMLKDLTERFTSYLKSVGMEGKINGNSSYRKELQDKINKRFNKPVRNGWKTFYLRTEYDLDDEGIVN